MWGLENCTLLAAAPRLHGRLTGHAEKSMIYAFAGQRRIILFGFFVINSGDMSTDILGACLQKGTYSKNK